ncbi:MAG: RNA polymerase sigma factor [Phycisphaerae bacterium]
MGHEADVEKFYRALWPHRAAVLRTARFLCRDVNEAEDLAQEVFIKAFGAVERVSEDRPALPWLMAILRHLRIDRLRAAGAHPGVSLEAVEVEPAAREGPVGELSGYSEEEMLEALSDQAIIDALRALPEEIRWTLLLVDVHGMDHGEAAEIEGVPEGTIKSRAHRGRRMMRELLSGVAKERVAM